MILRNSRPFGSTDFTFSSLGSLGDDRIVEANADMWLLYVRGSGDMFAAIMYCTPYLSFTIEGAC
jgi:hypothetical protein